MSLSFSNINKTLNSNIINTDTSRRKYHLYLNKDYEYKDHYENSLLTNKTEIINLINTKKEELPFNEFKQYLSELFKKYKIKKAKSEDSSSSEEKEKIENSDLKHSYRKNNSKEKKQIQKSLDINLNGSSDLSQLKIHIRKHVYKNPYESLDVIKENAKLLNDINYNIINRQKHFYEKAYEKVSQRNKNHKKMPKIKISNIIKPFIDLLIPESRKIEDEKKEIQTDNNKIKLYDLSNPFLVEKEEPRLFSSYIYANKNFPEGREQFAFVFNTQDIILYSGLTSSRNNYVWSLDPETLEWSKHDPTNNIPNQRYGHTGVLYGKKFYVFGGKIKLQNYTYLGDIEIYNLDDRTWSNVPHLNTKNILQLRRNHIGKIIGNQMIIHGGINENGDYLNDTYLLSFFPLKWSQCVISDNTSAPYLAGHAACLVLPADIKFSSKLQIYRFPDYYPSKNSTKLKEKGLYVFGGKKGDEAGLSNDLWILRIGKRPCEWHRVEPSGKKPEPRYGHSLNFYEKGNYIILHGGRNDYSNDSFALNDTWLLELTRLEWCEAKLYSTKTNFPLFNRCFHSAVIYGDNLIIFGGMNNNNYIGSSLFVLNLDLNYHLKNNFEIVVSNNTKPVDYKSQLIRKKTKLDKLQGYNLPPIK